MESGLRTEAFCLGCCWMLMALLFVGGLMNLLWIAALALLVLVEKTLPWGGRMRQSDRRRIGSVGRCRATRCTWSSSLSVG